MQAYILRRLLLLVPSIFGISVATFVLFRLIPGDPAAIICGQTGTEECLERVRSELGLDRPLLAQYADWVGDMFRGDFGTSIHGGNSLVSELRHRVPITLELLIMTNVIALALAIPAGTISAIRPNTPLDLVVRFLTVLGLSIPNFFLGTLLILLPLIFIDWTPPLAGYTPFFDDPWTNLQQFFFPSLALGAAIGAGLMRLTRSALLEVMGNDYIRTAWAKGLRERTVVLRHALKNAMIPVVTVLGLYIGVLMGGTVILEMIFGLPGLGRLTFESILMRDYPIVQGVVLITASVFVLVNLAVDVVYAWFDPRIRYA